MTDDQVFEDSDGNTDLDCDCGVVEGVFPCLGKCYIKSNSPSGDIYKRNCPHCSIWTSLPDGASLIITHIFECPLYGYGKRIKE